jgi:2-methylisocitrate lyase-like PEP mutase family enzyme
VPTVPAHADALRALHVPGRPLVLPNAWDAASARAVVAAGFPVVATSSAALVAALGYEDGGDAPADEVFAAVARIARAVDVPVTADIEDGYGLGPDDLAAVLIEAGAAGCNLEDSDHRAGGLVDVDAQTARLAAFKHAARARGVDLVLNARVDVFLRGLDPHEALVRARRYREAGADCVFPIAAPEQELPALVEAAGVVNAYARVDAPGVARLAGLGVARISFGSGLHRATETALDACLTALRTDEEER